MCSGRAIPHWIDYFLARRQGFRWNWNMMQSTRSSGKFKSSFWWFRSCLQNTARQSSSFVSIFERMFWCQMRVNSTEHQCFVAFLCNLCKISVSGHLLASSKEEWKSISRKMPQKGKSIVKLHPQSSAILKCANIFKLIQQSKYSVNNISKKCFPCDGWSKDKPGASNAWGFRRWGPSFSDIKGT